MVRLAGLRPAVRSAVRLLDVWAGLWHVVCRSDTTVVWPTRARGRPLRRSGGWFAQPGGGRSSCTRAVEQFLAWGRL